MPNLTTWTVSSQILLPQLASEPYKIRTLVTASKEKKNEIHPRPCLSERYWPSNYYMDTSARKFFITRRVLAASL